MRIVIVTMCRTVLLSSPVSSLVSRGGVVEAEHCCAAASPLTLVPWAGRGLPITTSLQACQGSQPTTLVWS